MGYRRICGISIEPPEQKSSTENASRLLAGGVARHALVGTFTAWQLTFPAGPVFGIYPPDCIAFRHLIIGKHPSNWGIAMRVLLLRIGVVGTVAVLGWIAIAHAQRGASDMAGGESVGGGSSAIDGHSRPVLSPPTGEVNPLRPATLPARQAPSRTEPAQRRPAADPFGLQNRHSGSSTVPSASDDSLPDASALGIAAPQRTAAEPARYPQLSSPAAAEEPPAGPALVAGESGRAQGDRYSSKPARTASRGSQQVAAPPAAVDSQEPAPFSADPFAMPARPTTVPKADRGSLQPLGAPVTSARAAEVAPETEGTGQPGGQQLEGVQSPQLTIQKTAPKEVQVGKPASFRITVRNTGPIPACEVEVRDLVPKGARLMGTTPTASRGTRGEVVWALGTIRPGDESSVEMQLMPTAEGEIGSVATVRFGADTSARSIATRPQLVVETIAPAKVLIGEPLNLNITVSNPGTGVATGVVLEERIPPGLQHPAGAELEYEIGDLKPGESRKLDLALVANRPGPTTNVLNARADGNLRTERKLDIEVVAPQLDVMVEGPRRRYLERQATYQVSVTNPGTAAAKRVELVATLPPGLKFVSTNNAGYYEESTRTVRWRLEELPANETGSVELVTLPVEAGRHELKLRGTAQKGLVVEKDQPVLVEGIAAMLFQVADTADPIEVGGETTYEVHVVNQGSKAAANVRLAVDLPPQMKPVAAEGPTRNTLDGNRVSFDGLARLAPKTDTTYRIRVKAIKAGDLRARFQLMTDDMQSPVSKEESTRVYADE